jgi:isopenicillin N synthase-like dioxygenase
MNGARGEFSQVPVLDVSELYGPGTTAIREVAEALRAHLESVGFLYVAGHRVPRAEVEAVRDMSKAFFALPE